jgi:hypothetical protein
MTTHTFSLGLVLKYLAWAMLSGMLAVSRRLDGILFHAARLDRQRDVSLRAKALGHQAGLQAHQRERRAEGVGVLQRLNDGVGRKYFPPPPHLGFTRHCYRISPQVMQTLCGEREGVSVVCRIALGTRQARDAMTLRLYQTASCCLFSNNASRMRGEKHFSGDQS